MKKVLLTIGLIVALIPTLAQAERFGSNLRIEHRFHAQHHHGHWHRGHGGGWTWVVPAIIGGAVVYSATRPDPVVVQQPVIVQQPTPQGQNCSPWTETQNPDGTITRTRTCSQ